MSVSTLRPLLPLGSVTVLHNGDIKLMIIERVPFYRDGSIFGYFDHVAMRYPVGLIEDSVAYFNAEDIAEVLFEGFADEEDGAIQTAYTSALASGGTPYQRLNTTDICSQSFKNVELRPYSMANSNRSVGLLRNHWWSMRLKPQLLCRAVRNRQGDSRRWD